MAFHKFDARSQRGSHAGVSIHKKGTFGFNKPAAEAFKKKSTKAVNLLWDPETLKIGIQPVDPKEAGSFKFQYDSRGKNGSTALVTGAAFLKWIGWIGYEHDKTGPTRFFQLDWNSKESQFELQLLPTDIRPSTPKK